MQYVVTGKTKMNNDKVCISLYDLKNHKYLRPLKAGKENFTEEELSSLKLFSIVDIKESPIQEINFAPHTEDIIVTEFTFYEDGSRRINKEETENFLAEISESSVDNIFGYNAFNEPNLILDNRNWGLRPQTGDVSLGTVSVLEFIIYRDRYGKVRVNFTDFNHKSYTHVPFVMKATDTEIENLLGHYDIENYQYHTLFLRLSLARPYKTDAWNDHLCALQVSNVNLYF